MKIITYALVTFFWFGLVLHDSWSQTKVEETKDSTDAIYIFKSPKKAALLSLAIPGAGHVYLGEAWKVPLIYGALGACTYFAIDNHRQYSDLQEAYNLKLENRDEEIDDRYDHLSAGSLKRFRDLYDRWYQMSLVFGIATYFLNSVWAYTDAHLQQFDIDENLSLRWEIDQQGSSGALVGRSIMPTMGLSIIYTFE